MRICFFAFILPFALSLGCTATFPKVKRYTDSYFAPTVSVDVLEGMPRDPRYEEIGEFSIDSHARDPEGQFIKQARLLGADAVVLMGEKNLRVFSHLIGERVITRRRSDVWALAIKYQEGFLLTKGIVGVGEAAGPEGAGPLAGAGKSYYAVVRLEKVYSSENWSAPTNFTVVTKAPSYDACLATLRNASKDQISSRCTVGGELYDKIFNGRAVGEWYVTIDMEDALPWAAIVEYGTGRSDKMGTITWTDDQKLEVATALAVGTTSQAEMDGVAAKVHIFSPKGEVVLKSN